MPDATDPGQLAEMINGLLRPWLIGVDVDGTLSPIAARPEDARLVEGAREVLDRLESRVGVMIAVVSGRPLADLHHQFAIPSSVIVIGSHGAEVGTEVDKPTKEESQRLAAVESKLRAILDDLPGAWIEHKPLAIALHVRQADPLRAHEALEALHADLSDTAGITLHRGHEVLEIAVRPISKGLAFEQLRRRLEPATAVFIGDDESDETVFEALAESDLSIKVGDGPTAADERVGTPEDVVTMLRLLAAME